jgi:hypothetical protein
MAAGVWAILHAAEDSTELPALLVEVAEWDPLRAEALAHAFADEHLPSVALRYLPRWEGVEERMAFLRGEGVDTPRDDVALVAHLASGQRFRVALDLARGWAAVEGLGALVEGTEGRLTSASPLWPNRRSSKPPPPPATRLGRSR